MLLPLALAFSLTTQAAQVQEPVGSLSVPPAARVNPLAKLKDVSPAAAAGWGDQVVASENVIAVGEEGKRGRVSIFEKDSFGDWVHRVTHDFEDGAFPTAIAVSDEYVAASFMPHLVSPTFQMVRIFERDFGGASNWGLAQELPLAPCGNVLNCPVAERWFGWQLDIVEDMLYVGDPMIAGFGGISGEGAVFVYRRDPIEANWQLATTIARGQFGSFGRGLSADGSRIAVYAGGAIEIRERNLGGPDAYGLEATIPAVFLDRFLLQGDTLFAGDGSSLSGVPGQVRVYERDSGGPGAWGEVARLRPNGPDLIFGEFFTAYEDTLYVGVREASGPISGRVEVFRRNNDSSRGTPDSWSRLWSIFDPAGSSPGFGSAVASAGPLLIVTDTGDDEVFPDSGAAWVLEPLDPPAGKLRSTGGLGPR